MIFGALYSSLGRSGTSWTEAVVLAVVALFNSTPGGPLLRVIPPVSPQLFYYNKKGTKSPPNIQMIFTRSRGLRYFNGIVNVIISFFFFLALYAPTVSTILSESLWTIRPWSAQIKWQCSEWDQLLNGHSGDIFSLDYHNSVDTLWL